MVVIGIDLGTTYSCVSVFKEGKVIIIPNELGNRITPSFVAFKGGERLIGDEAKDRAVSNPKNTIFAIKRLIGCDFNDTRLQEDMKNWPFKVVDEGGKPMVQVEINGKPKNLSPEEVSAMILIYMKQIAERYLGCSVTDAVITVPAYFNNAQRQATKDAGTIAGLNVLRIINEPTAAALAFGIEKKVKGKRNILIYDLGGGTFDVSILIAKEGPKFEVRSTSGEKHLGGEDFDNRLVTHLADEFNKKYKEDIGLKPKTLLRLKNGAIKAKHSLTSSVTATVSIDCIVGDIDFENVISRATFEDLCSDLFTKTLDCVTKAISDAKMDKSMIDDIVMVGGSSKILKIQTLLQEYFCKNSLDFSVHPDEAVACGAAIIAAKLDEDNSLQLEELQLSDVSPFSLGIEVTGGIMSPVIERNSRIPCTKTKNYTTTYDNQLDMTITIFEGERTMVKDNNLLGSFELTNIRPAPRGKTNIEVMLDLDADGILTVTAKEWNSDNSNNITIKNQSQMTQTEIVRLLAEAERHKEADKKKKEAALACNILEEYILGMKTDFNESGSKTSSSGKNILKDKFDDAFKWLESNKKNQNKHTFEAKLNELKNS